MSTMTVTMTSGEGIRRERSPRSSGEGTRSSGQARVALAVATNFAKRSTGCWIAYFVAWSLVTVFPIVFAATALGDSGDMGLSYFWHAEYAACIVGTAIGSIAAAVRVFGYAFKRSEADFAGALPLRRAGLFAASALAGFVPLVVVEALVAAVLVLLALVLPGIGFESCGWWLSRAVVFTFVFYAFALLCVQLSGTAGGAVWLFIGANLFIVAVEMVGRYLASYLIWGLELGADLALVWTSPALGMWRYGLGNGFESGLDYLPVEDITSLALILPGVDWGAIGLYAAAAVACTLLALLLNGVRPLERAGETVPYRWERVVCSCAGGVIGGLVLAVCSVLVASNLGGVPLNLTGEVAVAVFAGAGGFLGAVFLAAYVHGSAASGRFHVPWGLAGTVGAVVLAAGLGCAFDTLGIESRVPDPAQVKSVQVDVGDGHYRASFSSEEAVKDICAQHKAVLGFEDDARALGRADVGEIDGTTLAFSYKLQDGSTLRRSYTLPASGKAAKAEKPVYAALTADFNSREGVDSRLAVLAHKASSKNLEVDYIWSSGEDGGALMDDETLEFVTGPLTKDAREHGVLDVDDIASSELWYGKLGELNIYYVSYDDGDQGSVSTYVPVSRKGSPAIAKWLEEHRFKLS